MLTCPAGHTRTGSEKGVPEQFFVATAIKACYGQLPDLEEREQLIDADTTVKRPRFETAPLDVWAALGDRMSAVDLEYRRLYSDLRSKALADIRTLVREYVERMSTPSASYDFMNIYGICSFDPPSKLAGNAAETSVCKFTQVHGGPQEHNGLLSVTGILNPLVGPRVQHGELALTPCQEADFDRAVEEYSRINPRTKMRLPRVSHSNLGRTLGSLENQFVFTVREDLRTLGCKYREIVLVVELLYLNILHFIHT